jgi:hypothetical protein
MLWLVAADLVTVIHAGYVAFVVIGFVAISASFASCCTAIWSNGSVRARRKVRFLNPEGFINTTDRIPLHISAFAPKARKLTAEIADGWMTFYSSVPRAIHEAGELAKSCEALGRAPRSLYRTVFALGVLPFAIGFAIVVGNLSTIVLATGCSRPPAVAGMAVSFAGSTGQVSIPVVTAAEANVTLEAWVKLPTAAKGCFVKIGDANTGYGVGVGAAGVSFDDANPGNAVIGLYEGAAWLYPTGNPTLSTGAWHHVAFVIGAATSAPTFYIDGTPYAATASATPHAPANSADLGGDGIGGPRWSNATLAKVAVYNSALSAASVTAHATATSDATYDAAVLADSPVAFYELNEE